MAQLLYAAPAWCGFALAADCQRIERFIMRTVRIGYLPPEQPDAESLVTGAENRLLTSVNHRHYHVLRPLFQHVIMRRPGLRPRPHDFSLPHKDDHNYISRVLHRTLKLLVSFRHRPTVPIV